VPRRRQDSNAGSSERKGTGWRRFLPENPWVVIGPIVVALTIAGVTAGVKALTAKEPQSELQAFDPVVENPTGSYEGVPDPSDPTQTASRPTDASKARIEVRLQNNGNRRSVLTSAILTVRKQVVVTPCGLGAGLAVSATYDVVLPRRPADGQTVEVPIDQQLGPDEADRFVFSVGAEFAGGVDLGLVLIYQLDVAIRHDGSEKPTDVGRVVVALPGSPPDFVLPRDISSPQPGCEQDSLNEFREAAQLDGVRSPQLQRILASAQA